MELALARRIGQPQLVAEQLGEEVVVAVPLASGVERHEKEVRGLDGPQHRGGAFAASHGIAEPGVEAVEHRRSQQKVSEIVVLPSQHLGGQVVHHQAVVPGEVTDELVRVVSSL